MLRTRISFVSVKTVSELHVYLSNRCRYLKIRPMASETSPDRERQWKLETKPGCIITRICIIQIASSHNKDATAQKHSLSTGNFESSKMPVGLGCSHTTMLQLPFVQVSISLSCGAGKTHRWAENKHFLAKPNSTIWGRQLLRASFSCKLSLQNHKFLEVNKYGLTKLARSLPKATTQRGTI